MDRCFNESPEQIIAGLSKDEMQTVITELINRIEKQLGPHGNPSINPKGHFVRRRCKKSSKTRISIRNHSINKARTKLDCLPFQSPEKRLDAILKDKEYWNRYQNILEEAGIPWTNIIAHEAQGKLTGEILPLTPMKQLDTILKEQDYWSDQKDMLENAGISWNNVLDRESVLKARKTVATQKVADKKAQQEEKLIALAAVNPLADIGIASSTIVSNTIVLEIEKEMFSEFRDTPIWPSVVFGLKSLLRGFSWYDPVITTGHKNRVNQWTRPDPSDDHFMLEGSLAAWKRILDKKDTIAAGLAAIRAIDPDYIGTLNRKDAAEVCGLSQAAFDEAVRKWKIPVASVKTFHKWGKILEAKQFNPRDLVEFRETQAINEFLEIRNQRILDNRKGASAKARITRTQRQSLAKQVSSEDRIEVHNLVLKTKDLRAGLHLELFRWAQRASRFAKAHPGKAKTAYLLKDDALVCLFENQALNLTFVSSSRIHLIEKCKIHEYDWYDLHELHACHECITEISHHYSLYALSLDVCPEAGTLHMPYPTWLQAGFPEKEKLSIADHHRDVCHGRKLSNDESAIFTLKRITSEIERLVVVLDTSGE